MSSERSWALITGASQGIGYEFTRLFAADGHDLVLVARDRKRLDEVAKEMTDRHGVKVLVLVEDLSKTGAAIRIVERLRQDQVHITSLVNNAGFGKLGSFVDLPADGELDLINVNVVALVELSRLLLPAMIACKRGRILNVGSTAAYLPGPKLALYYASKAFVHSFTYALGKELEGTGVTATILCPGLTQSQFHSRAGLARPGGKLMMDAGIVARLGYDAMMRGKPIVVAGFLNRLGVVASIFMPVRMMMAIVAWLNRGKPGR